MKEYKLEIEAKRIEGEKNGKKYDFLAYSGFTVDGKKFGIYKCTVDSNKIWKDKQTKFNEYWIAELKTCEVFEFTPKENDDLPF